MILNFRLVGKDQAKNRIHHRKCLPAPQIHPFRSGAAHRPNLKTKRDREILPGTINAVNLRIRELRSRALPKGHALWKPKA